MIKYYFFMKFVKFWYDENRKVIKFLSLNNQSEIVLYCLYSKFCFIFVKYSISVLRSEYFHLFAIFYYDYMIHEILNEIKYYFFLFESNDFKL